MTAISDALETVPRDPPALDPDEYADCPMPVLRDDEVVVYAATDGSETVVLTRRLAGDRLGQAIHVYYRPRPESPWL